MKMTKSLLFVLLFSMTSSMAIAQKITITGKVTSNTGIIQNLSGVNVIASKKEATTTQADGTYSISVDPGTPSLTFSYIGYITQTVTIGNKSVIDVLLQPNDATTDEVVVIGYGTQRKSSLTGAVSKFKNEKLDEAPVARLDQALQGKIAGVQIQNTSTDAGSDPRIRVRGLGSVYAGASPLVVVDGQPIPDGLSFVNPADVESIEVLKDAASAAIYGSRGASGVIIITTKSGKADRTRYSVKLSSGVRNAYKRYPMMTMTEYGQMLFAEAALRAKDTTVAPFTASQIMSPQERAAYIIENTITGGPTNWQDQALRTANVSNMQLNVSGGSRQVKYFMSGAYQKDQGLMYHNEFERFSIRSKVDMQLSKRVKMTFNINPSYTKRERPSTGYIDFVRFYSFLPAIHTEATAAFVNQPNASGASANVRPGDFVQARHFNGRIYSGTMPDGSTYSTVTAVDPFATANNTPKSLMELSTNTSNDYRLQSSADLTINLAKGLDFRTQASNYISYINGLAFAKRNAASEGAVNQGTYTKRTVIDLLSENTLNYIKSFKNHNFSVLAGFTAQKTKTNLDQVVGRDYPSDNISTSNTALIIVQPSIDANEIPQGTYNLKNSIGLLSYLGRLTYDYEGKYLLSGSFRTDGSSYFNEGRKWGVFPAVSAGWVISKEGFAQNWKGLTNLKLRGSWGATGNNRITENDFLSAYPYLNLLYPSNYPFGTGTGTSTAGQTTSRNILANPLITWERTFQYNAGIDLSLFKNAVSLSVDVYQSKTEKLLLQQSNQLFTGVSRYWNNIGQLQNRGIEIDLTTVNIRTKNFRWTTNANLSHNRNKLLELGLESRILNQGERTEVYQNKVGDQFIQFYGYKTDGVWLSQKQIDEARAKGLTSGLSNLFVPGGLKLVDLNNDNKLDEADRTVIGTPYPDFNWGLTNSFTFKGFDVSVLLQGSQGGQLINGDPNYNETKRTNRNYNQNRWISPLNPGDGKTPYSTVGFNWMLTDYVVEDASYYTIREVNVGYTLPSNITKIVHVSSGRIYFSAQNLYYHMADGYRGINPEARFTTGPYATPLVDGYQRGSYPLPRTFLFGLDINF
jgi:TonB-dependent starch-binding outer membrane protein SusC